MAGPPFRQVCPHFGVWLSDREKELFCAVRMHAAGPGIPCTALLRRPPPLLFPPDAMLTIAIFPPFFLSSYERTRRHFDPAPPPSDIASYVDDSPALSTSPFDRNPANLAPRYDSPEAVALAVTPSYVLCGRFYLRKHSSFHHPAVAGRRVLRHTSYENTGEPQCTLSEYAAFFDISSTRTVPEPEPSRVARPAARPRSASGTLGFPRILCTNRYFQHRNDGHGYSLPRWLTAQGPPRLRSKPTALGTQPPSSSFRVLQFPTCRGISPLLSSPTRFKHITCSDASFSKDFARLSTRILG